jgi:hypothetical protein
VPLLSAADADGALYGAAADRAGTVVLPVGGELFVGTSRGLARTAELVEGPLYDVTVAMFPSTDTVGDVDGDGLPEVIVASTPYSDDRHCYYTWSAEVYALATPGTPVARSEGTSYRCAGPGTVLLGDLTGDGVQDAAVYDGSQAFHFDVSGATDWLRSLPGAPVRAGDLDGDGLDDLLLLDDHTSQLVYGPVPGPEVEADVELPGLQAALPGDLDGDGLDDLLVEAEGGEYAIKPVSGASASDIAFATFPGAERAAVGTLGSAPRVVLTLDEVVYDLRGPFAGAVSIDEARAWSSGESFGAALALDGDRLYVGEPRFDLEWTGQGAAYWFDP